MPSLNTFSWRQLTLVLFGVTSFSCSFIYFYLNLNVENSTLNFDERWNILEKVWRKKDSLRVDQIDGDVSEINISSTLKISTSFSQISNAAEEQIEILIWYEKRSFRQKRVNEILAKMPLRSCFDGCKLTLSNNQSDVDKADGVIFFMYNVGIKRENLPKRTNTSQPWIYYQTEPPPNYTPKPYMNNLFNWTMTYRQDSDIYIPHYKIYPISSSNSSYSDLIKGKSKLATAAISNCKTSSKREVILKQLKNAGISVDIYGRCGNKTVCGQYGKKSCDDFWNELGQTYKFYFAFENSLCVDYITEKFWRSLQLGLVPVVLGRGKYLEVAPPHSFIDLRDFSSPEELSSFIQKLDSDTEAYSKYFEWTRDYSVERNSDNFCELCAKLKQYKQAVAKNSIDLSIYTKTYPNMAEWLTSTENGKVCLPPDKLGFANFLK